MPDVLTSPLTRLQHAARRSRLIALLGALIALPSAFALLMIMPTGVLSGLVLLALMSYAVRKAWQIRRAARLLKQLRLEAQFVQHGPSPRHLPSCLRRRDHLWTRSLTLHGLEAVLVRSDAGPLLVTDKQQRIIHRRREHP